MKKILAFVCSLALCMTAFSANAENFTALSYFSDTDGHWAEKYIDELFDMGIMAGDNGNSRAEENITRGEFCALITRALYDVDSFDGTVDFPDVKKNDIFYKNIGIAVQNGIIKGDERGYFNGGKNITREEIVIITARVLADKDAYKKADFKDISSKYLYLDELEKVYGLGIISGDENKNFNPQGSALRSECAKMIYLTKGNHGKTDPATSVLKPAENYVVTGNGIDTSGAESAENVYRDEIASYARSLGFTADRTVENVKISDYDVKNSTAYAKFSYDISFDAKYGDGSGKTRVYTGETTVKMMRKNGKWTVYKTEESLKLKEKINLTWEVLGGVPSYAPSGVNVVSPTWYEIISDSSYKNSETVYQDKQTTLKITDKSSVQYLDYARKNGYDVWIAYRNNFNSSDTAKFLNSDSAKNSAVRFLIKGVADTKADGINIDFENMSDKSAFANHVRAVSLALRRLGLVTSVDVNKYDKTGGNWSLCYDRDKLGVYADYTAIMAYDQNGSWSKTSGPVAGLDWAEDVVKTTLSEVGADKLILGVPFYVRIWQEKDGKVVKSSAVSMDYAKKTVSENGANVRYDAKIGQNIYTWSDGEYDYKIYMEDETSIKNKISLVGKYSLAGVASWRRGFESADIWQVIKDGI